jgi:hypothetical protein
VSVSVACSSHSTSARREQRPTTSTSTTSPASTTTTSLPEPLPPGFALSGGSTEPPRAKLDVEPVHGLNPTDFHPVALDSAQVSPEAQAIVNQAVPTSVRPLLITSGAELRPGESVTVVAARLGAGPAHDALFILQGPNRRAEQLVQVSSGISAGRVHIPDDLGPGRWDLAVEDLSGIQANQGAKPSGTVLLDLAQFSV